MSDKREFITYFELNEQEKQEYCMRILDSDNSVIDNKVNDNAVQVVTFVSNNVVTHTLKNEKQTNNLKKTQETVQKHQGISDKLENILSWVGVLITIVLGIILWITISTVILKASPENFELKPFDSFEPLNVSVNSDNEMIDDLEIDNFESVCVATMEYEVKNWIEGCAELDVDLPEPITDYVITDINSDGSYEGIIYIKFGEGINLYCLLSKDDEKLNRFDFHSDFSYYQELFGNSIENWNITDYILVNTNNKEIVFGETVIPETNKSQFIISETTYYTAIQEASIIYRCSLKITAGENGSSKNFERYYVDGFDYIFARSHYDKKIEELKNSYVRYDPSFKDE